MGRSVAGRWRFVGWCAALGLTAFVPQSSAHADRVHLAGGSVIEGKVSREADKVVIALDSGSVRIDAASVVRIEKSETPADRISARRAGLPKDDIPGRLALANDCRDERLMQCERELLREVLALDPEHAEARARLGYVRGEHGWLTREEQQRALAAKAAPAAEQAAAVRKAELERDAAELARQQAELSVEAQRLALRAAQAQARAEAEREASTQSLWYGVPYSYYPGYRGFRPHPQPHPHTLPPSLLPAQSTPTFSINGMRHPASYFP